MSTAAAEIESFFAGGVPAAKFADGQYGTVIGGEITTEPRMQQQRDYTTGDPITYPDGNPAMQMVVTVQTGLRDPAIDGDTGERAFYIRGQLRQAVGEALRKAGAKAPQNGGTLQVKYLRDEPVTLKNGRPGNPQKIYAAKYEPPAQAAAGQFFDDPGNTMTLSGKPAAPGAGAGTSSPLPCPPGIPPATWQAMNPDQQQQMALALGYPPPGPAGGGEPPF